MKRLTDPQIGLRAATWVRDEAFRRRISLTEMVQLLGVTRGMFYSWEDGDFSPSASALQALCKEGADVNYILKG